MVQCRRYVSEHCRTGERRCYRAAPEIPLRGGQQMVTFTLFETRFEALGKARGWLYRRKISEEQKRSADPRIVLRTVLTFSNVSLHANQLDPGKGIVYKGNVLITKLATIHVGRLRVR